MKNKITFLGMGLDSDNKGVNALCVGAVEVVKNKYPDLEEITLISFRKNVPTKEYIISTANGEIKIYNKFFSKNDLIESLKDVVLFRLFRREPNSLLSKELYNSKIIFDLNEGDSFSDIYGLQRILRHFIDSFLAIMFKKDLVFLPQTLGPFNTLVGKTLGLFILKRVKKLYVRDDKAIKLLKSNNINYTQTIDLAVYMKPKEVIINLPSDFVAININGLMYYNNYASLKDQFTEYKNVLIEIVKYFNSIEKHILFVPHTYNVENPQEEDDLEATKHFVENYNITNCTILQNDYDAQELKYIISKSNFFVGSRMHSCIGALSRSIPTIGIAYSYKFKGTFSMFNCQNTVIEVNNTKNTEIEEIINEIINIYNQKEEIQKALIIENNRKILEL